MVPRTISSPHVSEELLVPQLIKRKYNPLPHEIVKDRASTMALRCPLRSRITAIVNLAMGSAASSSVMMCWTTIPLLMSESGTSSTLHITGKLIVEACVRVCVFGWITWHSAYMPVPLKELTMNVQLYFEVVSAKMLHLPKSWQIGPDCIK